jgi:hypothetical protein
VYFSDDEKANVIIGEAALTLITNHQEVSVDSLLKQLQKMTSQEKDKSRLREMGAAIKWLTGFRTVSVHAAAEALWLSGSANTDDLIERSTDEIRLKDDN